MYRFTNISFERLLPEFGITDLSTASNDVLVRICEKVGITPVWESKDSKLTGNLLRLKTIELIEKSKSYDIYMDEGFFEERHRQSADENKIKDSLKEHSSGRQTFQLFQRLKIGFSELKPGTSIDLDVTKRWVEDIAMKHPMFTQGDVKVEDLNEAVPVTIEPEVVTPVEVKEERRIALEDTSYKNLQKEYTDRVGKKAVGVSRVDIITKLKELDGHKQ